MASFAGPPSPAWPLVPLPGERGDNATLAVDLADFVIAGVGDVNVAGGMHGDAVRDVQLGIGRRTAISFVAFLAVAGDRVNDALRVDLPEAVGELDDVEIAGVVAPHAENLPEFCFGRFPAGTAGAATGDELQVISAC